MAYFECTTVVSQFLHHGACMGLRGVPRGTAHRGVILASQSLDATFLVVPAGAATKLVVFFIYFLYTKFIVYYPCVYVFAFCLAEKPLLDVKLVSKKRET